MTPRRIFRVPAPKKCAEIYRGLNPRGRGPRGLIGFVFRVRLSFQKIKNLVLFSVILFGSGYSGFQDNLLFYPRPGLFLKRLSAKKFFKKFFYVRVEKRAVFRYIRYVTDNMDMEPLLKSYIVYAMGFVPKERMAYAANNGEYDRIKIMVNSNGNIVEPGTYAITFELYNGDRRIIIGSLWLSGRCIYIIETVANVVLYKRRIQEMMEFEEFCNADNNIPKGILKITSRLYG